jgi:hypothetical protein
VIVLAVIAGSVGMMAAPGAASDPGPALLAGVVFADAWTNDDGTVDQGDLGDTGLASPGYDAWDSSSSDPVEPGIDPPRHDKDVAICTATVRPGDPEVVDVAIDQGYPGYVCTFATVVENATPIAVGVAVAAVESDPGLQVATVSPLPEVLQPGAEGVSWSSVTVLQKAGQDQTLAFSLTILVSYPACDRTVVFGVERGSGDLYEIDLTHLIATRIADIVDPEPGNVNSPNGLAHDPVTGRLYFSASLEGGTSSRLFFWDGSTVILAGTVPGQAAGADIHAGAYYYVPNATDDLVKVTFNSDGTVAAVATLYSGFADPLTFRFGDIVITADGSTLYGSTLQSGTTPPTFFSLGLVSGSYTTVSTTSGTNLQLAYGSDAVLYGHSTGAGGFMVVDPAIGSTTPVGTPVGALDTFTDLASAERCAP